MAWIAVFCLMLSLCLMPCERLTTDSLTDSLTIVTACMTAPVLGRRCIGMQPNRVLQQQWLEASHGCNLNIYALNTSRPCTGTADFMIFSDFQADGKNAFTRLSLRHHCWGCEFDDASPFASCRQ